MRYIDANIFLRHLTRDDPKMAQACLDLFQKAKHKEVALTTTESVIAEVVFVLSSKQLPYNLSRMDIRTRLYPLLSLPGLRLPKRRVYLRALDLYASYTIDFEDALLIAHMERQKSKEIYSYDREFDQIPSLKRLEP